MNCNNIRKYFYAFLDGELDVEKNIEVLAHLNMCYECSLKIERERLIQKRVKETVSFVNAPAYLERKILSSTGRRPTFFTLFKRILLFRSRLAPFAAVAAVIILIVGFFVIQNNLKRQAVLKALPQNVLLTLIETKYHDYMMKKIALDMRSRNARKIVEYLQKQTGLSVRIPGIKENVQLIGATLSEIDGVKVPLVFYMHDATPVVLLIACNTDIDFTKMKEVSAGKMMVYTGTAPCGSCQIIVWKETGNQYVMLSMIKSEKMINMLTRT